MDMANPLDLSGRVAIVTGASRGIGQATALALSRAGAHVVCVSTTEDGSRKTVELLAAGAGDAGRPGSTAGSGEPAGCDIASAAAVEALAERVLKQHGKVDILVNNAGITKDTLLFRMAEADFDRVLQVNLKGAFLMTRAFARPMLKARSGRIINVGSVVGLTGNAGQANYAASKAGLIGFSKSVARELASRGVTVNVVAPGFVETDMTSGLPPEVREAALREIPLGRFGAGADIAGAILFLSSPLASYVTGQVLVVDGGMTM
jgi:3-oxoacyl-[acyl-carrier protein] reductase